AACGWTVRRRDTRPGGSERRNSQRLTTRKLDWQGQKPPPRLSGPRDRSIRRSGARRGMFDLPAQLGDVEIQPSDHFPDVRLPSGVTQLKPVAVRQVPDFWG